MYKQNNGGNFRKNSSEGGYKGQGGKSYGYKGKNDKPAYRSDKPAFGNDKPAFGQDKPAFGQGKPAYGKKPYYGKDKPKFGQDKPAFGNDKPAYRSDKPAYGQDKPAYGQKPYYGKDKPIFGQDKPAFGSDKPAYRSDKPAFGQDKPAYGQGKPAYGKKPYYGKDKPKFGQDKPAFGQGKPYFGKDKYPQKDKFTPAPAAVAPVKEAPAAEEEAVIENMLEGRNPIREALKAGRQIEKILVAQGEIQGSVKEIIFKAHQQGVIVQEVERIRLDRISQTGSHQGIIAYVAAKDYCTIEDILEVAKERGEKPFVLLLDGITDPQNLGSILRSAECAGVHGVVIPKRRAVGLTPIVAKASAGAIEYMHVAKVTNISQTIDYLKKQGLWIFGASMEGKNYAKTNLKGPIALVIGGEGEGISALVKQRCDCLVSIPQLGKIESLNAAVSAAVIMYDCVRQRVAEE